MISVTGAGFPLRRLPGENDAQRIQISHRGDTGDKVVMFYVSGNRDEAAFPDPDALVLDREEPRILSFGSGIHRCIGFRLARMQLQFMWDGMLDRFSGFELMDTPKRLRSNFVQGFLSMPVIARV